MKLKIQLHILIKVLNGKSIALENEQSDSFESAKALLLNRVFPPSNRESLMQE